MAKIKPLIFISTLNINFNIKMSKRKKNSKITENLFMASSSLNVHLSNFIVKL